MEDTMTVSAQPRVTVVVLSYARPAMLARALESVVATVSSDTEILVIDNPSADVTSIDEVVGRFQTRIKLVRNATNLGFAGGMNVGLRLASGDFVYLTEDDIVLERDALQRLVKYLEGAPDVGLVGPLMVNDGSGTVRFGGASVNIGADFGTISLFAREEGDSNDRAIETGFLPGASILARTSFLRSLGGFREDFFMYQEDIELCARVRRSGLRIVLLPTARIRHMDPVGSRRVDLVIEFHKLKNLFFLHFLHTKARHLPIFVARYLRHTLGSKSGLPARIRLHALGACIWSLPRLLRDRRRLQRYRFLELWRER